MGAHHQPEQENDQSGKGVHRERIRFGWRPLLLEAVLFLASVESRKASIQQVSDCVRFDEHTAQATTKKHDGNRDMFQILRGPCTTPASQVLQEHVRRSVKKDDK